MVRTTKKTVKLAPDYGYRSFLTFGYGKLFGEFYDLHLELRGFQDTARLYKNTGLNPEGFFTMGYALQNSRHHFGLALDLSFRTISEDLLGGWRDEEVEGTSTNTGVSIQMQDIYGGALFTYLYTVLPLHDQIRFQAGISTGFPLHERELRLYDEPDVSVRLRAGFLGGPAIRLNSLLTPGLHINSDYSLQMGSRLSDSDFGSVMEVAHRLTVQLAFCRKPASI